MLILLYVALTRLSGCNIDFFVHASVLVYSCTLCNIYTQCILVQVRPWCYCPLEATADSWCYCRPLILLPPLMLLQAFDVTAPPPLMLLQAFDATTPLNVTAQLMLLPPWCYCRPLMLLPPLMSLPNWCYCPLDVTADPWCYCPRPSDLSKVLLL